MRLNGPGAQGKGKTTLKELSVWRAWGDPLSAKDPLAHVQSPSLDDFPAAVQITNACEEQ